MSFLPPFCPHEGCANHGGDVPDFFTRHGYYRSGCLPRPVPRFRCRACRRTFSRQTFRASYRDHKPHLNAQVVALLCSGVGFRQTARLVGLSRRCLELKARKLSWNARNLDRNVKRRRASEHLSPDSLTRVQFDEFETFEARRNTRPLSIAVAIEERSRLFLAAVAAPIRPKGTMTMRRREAIRLDEARGEARRDRSELACRSAFRDVARMTPCGGGLILQSDLKSTYPRLAKSAFGSRLVAHEGTSSRRRRDTANPLFPINHAEACMRDWIGRLRRRSWLASKERTFLNLHLGLYMAWRNWVCARFNHDSRSPGMRSGRAPRRLLPGELVGWRQAWGSRSPCPWSMSEGRGTRRLNRFGPS